MRRHRLEARATGFTLVEVLISLGIFVIGMVAVASLFPVAAILQKETRQDVVGQHVSDNAVAIVRAKGISAAEMTSYYTGPDGVNNANVEALFLMDNSTTVLDARFQIGDRSYPTSIPLTGASNPAENRDLYWVPMIQDRDATAGTAQWVMYLFVLEGDSKADYGDKSIGIWANPLDTDTSIPGVTFRSVVAVPDVDELDLGANHGLRAGDMILDNNGTTYTISAVNGDVVTVIGAVLTSPADPTYIWYAPAGAGGTRSPTLDIVVISNSSEASKQIVSP